VSFPVRLASNPRIPDSPDPLPPGLPFASSRSPDAPTSPNAAGRRSATPPPRPPPHRGRELLRHRLHILLLGGAALRRRDSQRAAALRHLVCVLRPCLPHRGTRFTPRFACALPVPGACRRHHAGANHGRVSPSAVVVSDPGLPTAVSVGGSASGQLQRRPRLRCQVGAGAGRGLCHGSEGGERNKDSASALPSPCSSTATQRKAPAVLTASCAIASNSWPAAPSHFSLIHSKSLVFFPFVHANIEN